MSRMNLNPWGWGWDAIAAIGQVVGALATFLAILVAIYQNKPKVKVMAFRDGEYLVNSRTMQPIEFIGKINVIAVNAGLSAVGVTMIGYKMPHACYTTTEEELKKLPKLLMPGERVEASFDSQDFKRLGLRDYDIFYALDNTGKAHFCRTNILLKVRRFLWWNLGKYSPKYYKFYKENNFKEPT
jgi:hypothetical protein